MRPGLRWALFAVVGLIVAAAVALLATQLVSERIGITGEPERAGRSLTPTARHDTQAARTDPPTTSTTASPANTQSTEGSEGDGKDDSGDDD